MASPSKRSEDVYGQKLDRCLYNGLIKFVTGVGVGIVFSALLFKRKPWPVILGGGIGTGMGISDCNNEFKSSGFREVSPSYQLMENNQQPPLETHKTEGYKRQRCSRCETSKDVEKENKLPWMAKPKNDS